MRSGVCGCLLRRASQPRAVAPRYQVKPLARCMVTKASEEMKKWEAEKDDYNDRLKYVRKQYIEELAQKRKREAEEKAAELRLIRRAKHKRLLIKHEAWKARMAELAELDRIYREKQRVIDERRLREKMERAEAHRKKQANLVAALNAEAAHWVTPENVEEKINDSLWKVAGRSTGVPTRYSANWRYMAVARVPDFSQFAEEELFDETADVHFLIQKSPFRIPKIQIEGHELYEGRVEQADGEEAEQDGNIYLDDGAYEPSFVGRIVDGEWAEFNPAKVPQEELPYMAELAERYEEHLLEIAARDLEREEEEEKKRGGKKKEGMLGDDDSDAEDSDEEDWDEENDGEEPEEGGYDGEELTFEELKEYVGELREGLEKQEKLLQALEGGEGEKGELPLEVRREVVEDMREELKEQEALLEKAEKEKGPDA